MPDEPSNSEDGIRPAELAAALCRDGPRDGRPFGHGLNATEVAMRLGERLEIDAQTAPEKGPPTDAVARAGLEVQEVVAHA